MDWRPPRIFISYARTDGRPLAERLESLLRAHTLTSWRDKQSMGSGDILPQVLRAIEESEHLALILSPAALASDWVKREWTHARLHAKQVSPILADKSLTRADLPPWARRQQIYDLDDPEEANLLIETLKRPAQARRVPYMSGHLPEDFVPRPQEFARLKQAILAPTTDTNVGLTTALRGAGGYGKTSLANYLCRDPDICAEFSDGVLRIDIGRERTDIIGSVLELCQLLDPKTNHPGFQSAESAADYLASLIGEARILLVIDDVWREAQLRPFLRPRPNCVRLVTTRKPEILPRDCIPIPIDEMRCGESLQVLSARLPGANDPATQRKLRALADRLGNWAQMLRIANGWLRTRTDSDEPLLSAIVRFENRLTRNGLKAFDPKDERERNKAISACLEPSLEELGRDLPRFCELAVLPEDENVPLDVIVDLWRETANLDAEDAEDLFPRFNGLSLLQNLDLGGRTLSLHDNTLWYMRDRLGADGRQIVHAAMVRCIAAHCGGSWATLSASHQYGWRNQINHLRAAGNEDHADQLITSYDWIKSKLLASGAQSLFEVYLTQANSETARLIGRAIALSVPTLAFDTAELARQLYGRLGDICIDGLADLVASAQRDPSFSPVPRWPSLTPPGAEMLRFVGHERRLTSASFSTDGNQIITASRDGTVRLWDPSNGKEIGALHTSDPTLNFACLSPNDATIVTTSNHEDARLWETGTGRELLRLRGHTGPQWSACFSADGTRIVTASFDGTARVWNAATGEETAILKGHGSRIDTACFFSNGTRIVTASRDFSARIWDTETGNELIVLYGHRSAVNSACASPDGSRIVTASRDGTVRLFDSSSGRQILVFGNHELPVGKASFSPDGYQIVACRGKTATLWQTETGEEISVFRGHESIVIDSCFSPDGTRILTASIDKSARLWDIAGRQKVNERPGHGSEINCASFSPNGGIVITASGDMTARLWDPRSGREVAALVGHEGSIHSARFSADGSRALTASSDGTARVWDIATSREATLPHRHTNSVTNAYFCLDGTENFITISKKTAFIWDMTARLFDIAPAQRFVEFGGDRSPVTCGCPSPDGKRIATAHYDGSVRMWNIRTQEEEFVLRGHEGAVLYVGFSPNGQNIVTGSADKTVRLWDAEERREIIALRGHQAAVNSACFSSNARYIVSRSDDKTARLWNVEFGQEISRITLEAGVTALSLHGTTIALGDALGRIHIYDAKEFLAAEASAYA